MSDSTKCPITDEILILLIFAVYSGGTHLTNQMEMLKTLLSNVGQARMAQSIAAQKNLNSQKMTEKQYQKLFEFFGALDKSISEKEKLEKAQNLKKIQEENAKKLEEKMRKEKEKQAEKERIEAKKREEKERKEREKREEKEKKEREIRENAERKRREEEDRIRAQRMLKQQEEDLRRKREAEEAVEKELERRAKMEKEAANALQGLEEDLLMDDIDFVTEQQSKVDEERKIAEAKRAEERENQIKMMRAQRELRLKEEIVEQPVTVIQETVPSTSQKPPVDILNAAQEALGLDSFEPKVPKQEIPTEKPMSAFEKLQSLRGRTMSADMKRDSPFLAKNQNQQHFFPTTSSTQPLQHMDPPFSTSEAPRLQHQNSNLQVQNSGIQMPQQIQNTQMDTHTPIYHPQPIQQTLQHQNPNSMSSGNLVSDFGGPQNMEIREANKRSMSMSQMNHHQSPQNLQQQHHQQFPSYQSPIMNNTSSLMHTPLSNNSMVSQSSQFSSQPSPMSQQFHTPPSVGTLQSPMAQQPLQHFNGFNQQQPLEPQFPMGMQMQAGLSQSQNQRVQQILRQQQELNMKMHQINQYPPHPPQ